MKKLFILFGAIWLGLISCNKLNPCDDIVCFTPPPDFIFKITDKATGENLYTNQVLDTLDLILLDENGTQLKTNFISENQLNLIQLDEIGWNTGLHQYQLILSNDLTIAIKLNMEEAHENCCTFFKTNDFQILNYEYSQESSAIYVVKVD